MNVSSGNFGGGEGGRGRRLSREGEREGGRVRCKTLQFLSPSF